MGEYECIIGTTTRGYTLVSPVTLSGDDLRQHLHIIGASGSGKTELLKRLVYAHLDELGQDFVLLDPLGGLAEATVDAVPPARNDEIIYFAPGHDLEHCVGFNPLDQVAVDQRHLVADNVVGAFMHIWGASLDETPRLIYLLYNSIRLLLDDPEGATLLGLPRLLVDDRYRDRLLRHSLDPVVSNFWSNEFARYDDRFRAQVISPAQNKIGMLLAPPVLRNILGQRRSTINIGRLMNEGGSLIANLSKGKLGSTGSALLGALIVTAVSQTAQERASIPFKERRPVTLITDEMQNFATTAFAEVVSELRNFALAFVGCHQYLAQLPHELHHAVLANCSTKIVFRVSASEDACRLAGELALENTSLLAETANYKAWVRLMRNGLPGDPLFVDMLKAEPPAVGRKAAVVAHTRARHTRPRAAVEAVVARQITG